MKKGAILVIAVGIFLLGVPHTSHANLIVLGNGNAPIYVSDKDSGRFDMNNDGLTDYYVKAHYTGNSHQTYKVDYKIQDECVAGSTYQTASMKLGFTTREFFFFDRVWITGIDAWNPWFRAGSNDDNKKVDLVALPKGALPFPFPATGDDLIVGANEKRGSFTYGKSIPELDGQSGWEGSVFFKAPPGEYFMWTIHPADGSSGCRTLTGFAIPIIVK